MHFNSIAPYRKFLQVSTSSSCSIGVFRFSCSQVRGLLIACLLAQALPLPPIAGFQWNYPMVGIPRCQTPGKRPGRTRT